MTVGVLADAGGPKTRCTRILGLVYVGYWIVSSRLQSTICPLVESQMADRTARFPFLASAEVASDDSVELTRVTELSRHRCYLETTKHRTAGTRVTVKIINKDQTFKATATVLYSRPATGMAVAFREVKPLFRSMLKDWLHQSLEEQNRKPSIDNLKLSKSIHSGALMSQKVRRSPRLHCRCPDRLQRI
jgi:hypothetical protein